MFESLLNFWKGKDFLIQVFGEFKEMLTLTKNMYDLVIRKLIDNETVGGLKEQIYEIDKKVNESEKLIRRKIAQHLLLQPSVDVTACLLLMSVVKDAERLGDYCKNLFEITELLEKPINKKLYNELFDSIDKDVAELFGNTQKAFMESNEAKARLSFDEENKIIRRSDEAIKKLAKSTMPVNEAVCFTLLARHFKRLASHLANIASAVVMPIQDLDYFDEKQLHDKKK